MQTKKRRFSLSFFYDNFCEKLFPLDSADVCIVFFSVCQNADGVFFILQPPVLLQFFDRPVDDDVGTHRFR